MKNTLFISDLHLSVNQSQITEHFNEFINNISSETEALYILGDFFEFWAGDDDNSQFNQQIKNTLRSLQQKNIHIYLMSGNRDFLLGENFANECQATLLPDPSIINLYGKKTLLTHGDILCTDDYGLRVFRFFTNNKFLRKLFLLFPLIFRKNLAQKVRNYFSRKNHTFSKIDVNQKEILHLMNLYNAKLIIHGHLHRQSIEPNRIALGNWDANKSSILTYFANGQFVLK